MKRLVLAAFAVLNVSAAPQPADIASHFDSVFESARREQAIPALGLGVIENGEIVYVRAFGAPEHARFRAASIAKLFTAQAIMHLAEEGALTLDDDVGAYVPAMANRGVTLRQLMTHTSGVPDGPPPQESADARRSAQYAQALAAIEPLAAPGAAWRYTDSEYNLLGAVIATASGRDYMDYVAEFVAPLAAPRLTLFPATDERGDVLRGSLNYVLPFPAPERPYDIAYAPSEGLVTDVEGLTRWLQATLNHDPRLLAAETFEQMLVPQFGEHAALGWQVRTDGHGRRVMQHGGSFVGWSALAIAYPDQRRGFVILTNGHDAPRWEFAAMADAILDGRDVTPPTAPWGRRGLFTAMVVTLLGLGAAIFWAARRR